MLRIPRAAGMRKHRELLDVLALVDVDAGGKRAQEVPETLNPEPETLRLLRLVVYILHYQQQGIYHNSHIKV